MAFTLQAKPTFKITVHIPVAGSTNPDDGKLTITFNHQNTEDMKANHKAMVEGVAEAIKTGGDILSAQVEYLQTIIHAWALKDELNEANIRLMLLNYAKAFDTIASGYLAAMMGGKYEEDRTKN